MAETEQQIRERAYAIWEQEGRPEGRAPQHWQQAVEEAGGGAAADSAEGDAQSAPTAGLASGLQPGGRQPGGGPAPGMGSVGTGGGSTGGRSSGS